MAKATIRLQEEREQTQKNTTSAKKQRTPKNTTAAKKQGTPKNTAADVKKQKKDTLNTVYECPVCEDGVALKVAQAHLARHRKQREVSASLEDLVYGLEYVAAQVELQTLVHCPRCGVGLRQNRLVRHESRCKANRPKRKGVKQKGVNRVWNAADPDQDRKLPQFGSGSRDLFNSGRMVSGGGPGTGKKR